MDFVWYLNRLKKMGPAETAKRLVEFAGIFYSKVRYKNPASWPYHRFAKGRNDLSIVPLPGRPGNLNPQTISIYSDVIDATRPIDWHKSDFPGMRWPVTHWSTINYRPGNPYGDIRVNWELNRLQFLPHLALADPMLAIRVLNHWLQNNPYLHGPGYVATMEVALRWISIYRSVCLMGPSIGRSLIKDLTGLAVASGKYILSRLSTHSSAGNHLIVEAVGLFWIGKALGADPLGKRWRETAREILWREIPAQIHPDGTSKEQTFWYLGFVLDAVFHYLLLEDRPRIPVAFLSRIEAALEYISLMAQPNGTYPDFGDRDDGYVFRADGDYQESLFNGLLDIGSCYFDRPQWRRNPRRPSGRIHFWFPGSSAANAPGPEPAASTQPMDAVPYLRTFPQGGMTVMKWAKTHLLFRHGPLGLGNTCGHGHADSLSLLMVYRQLPVLIDLGSAQYNGDQGIRNFFRSTAAHNTVQLGVKNQAEILGPFLWKGSYHSTLLCAQTEPIMTAEACHDGYVEAFNISHFRKVVWHSPCNLEVIDSFRGPGKVPMQGAFHLGACKAATLDGNRLVAQFSDFSFSIGFPENFQLEVFKGSQDPFMGWRGGIYGSWSPIYAVTFSSFLEENFSYSLKLNIDDQSSSESITKKGN